jgi:ABC-type Fe3+ transport system substrate-binding protein
MLNQMYVNWLVGWIRNSTINIKTGLPFTVDDILLPEYKTAVQAALSA